MINLTNTYLNNTITYSSYQKVTLPLCLFNLVCIALLNISPVLAEGMSSYIPKVVLFVVLVISFCAVCYTACQFYMISAEEFDPAGVCIIGFILPVLTAFVATANWNAFAILSAAETKLSSVSHFSNISLAIVFVLFFAGSATWGVFMKLQNYATDQQSIIATGYTVFSYWFGFVVFSWLWLFWTAITS